MPPANIFTRLILILVLSFSLLFTSCSYLPWVGEDGDDLAFEEDFPFEDERVDSGERRRGRGDDEFSASEDDFVAEDKGFFDIDADEDGFIEAGPDGFASIDQRTDKSEL